MSKSRRADEVKGIKEHKKGNLKAIQLSFFVSFVDIF